MSAIDSEALAGLIAAVESLLPETADPSVRLVPLVTLVHAAPTGIGGLVGTSDEPRGQIFGRRLKATALVTVQASGVDPLNSAVAAVTRAFAGADRTELLQRGILQARLESVGAQAITGSGANRIVERGLTFEVLYEFLKGPEEPEGVILEIPVNLDTP